MQEFLEGLDDYKSLSRGEVVDGVVMRVDPDGVLVDINSKSEGFVPAREMQSLGSEGLAKLKVGDDLEIGRAHV
jgi:small subunit ribosomal protein S1